MEVSKSVVEQQCVDLPFIDGSGRFSLGLCPPARLHPLNCGRACKARRPRSRIEQQGFSIGNDSRRCRISTEPALPAPLTRDALVTAAENRHSPSSGLQSASKLLNNRRLTRSAHREIADADHETPERAFAENPFDRNIAVVAPACRRRRRGRKGFRARLKRERPDVVRARRRSRILLAVQASGPS